MPQLGGHEIKVGDTLAHWHDTGAKGYQLYFSKVLKVFRKYILVQGERGEISRKTPEFFDKVVPPGANIWADTEKLSG